MDAAIKVEPPPVLAPESEEQRARAHEQGVGGQRQPRCDPHRKEQARSGGKTTDLWLEMGKNGYLGINIPEAYGGGGGGIGDIAAV